MILRKTLGPLSAGFVLLAVAALGCGAEGRDSTATSGGEAAGGPTAATEMAERAVGSDPIDDPKASGADAIDVEGSASLGPADAPVTLVEYSDFQ